LAARVFQAERLVRAAPAVDAKAAEAALKRLAADRVAIEAVVPELDGGRHPVKRVVGDVLEVEADVFCDGHDKIAARSDDPPSGREAPSPRCRWRS
jgi:starch synthase (maltosyl-transferring)